MATGEPLSFSTAAGRYHISLTTDPSPVTLGKLFAINLVVMDAGGAPVPNATVAVNATMPQHGHGMATNPEDMAGACDSAGICLHEGGKYRTEGMKFHMPGEWRLTVDIAGPAGNDKATVVLAI